MADIPSPVLWGIVTGYFTTFLSDTALPAPLNGVPDERPLNGEVILTPLTPVSQWPTSAPPRLSILQPVTAFVEDGVLSVAPGVPNVPLVATDQPDGKPDLFQWRATFRFDDVVNQPVDKVFNVPAGGFVDLGMIVTIPPSPGTIIVVSHQDALDAAESADDAAQSAEDAANAAGGGGMTLKENPADLGLYELTPPDGTGNQFVTVNPNHEMPVIRATAGDIVQTGRDITANRPDPVAAGAGAVFYDTTLPGPIWSDGVEWQEPVAAVRDKQIVTADYTVLDTDGVIFTDAAVGVPLTITLIDAALATGDIRVANISPTEPAEIVTAGGTIDGATSFTLGLTDSVICESTGTNWVIF